MKVLEDAMIALCVHQAKTEGNVLIESPCFRNLLHMCKSPWEEKKDLGIGTGAERQHHHLTKAADRADFSYKLITWYQRVMLLS
jgi:hypothetical protein